MDWYSVRMVFSIVFRFKQIITDHENCYPATRKTCRPRFSGNFSVKLNKNSVPSVLNSSSLQGNRKNACVKKESPSQTQRTGKARGISTNKRSISTRKRIVAMGNLRTMALALHAVNGTDTSVHRHAPKCKSKANGYSCTRVVFKHGTINTRKRLIVFGDGFLNQGQQFISTANVSAHTL
jgi:hypothetical protein|uniref:Uncharacterized protein n=1 Tax=Sipha flava TaxID=143950 RepID=A0A2S2PYY6_9HEMI